MARMLSPAGEMKLEIDAIGIEGDALAIRGKMGVWEATILLERDEVWRLARIAPKRQLAAYFARPLLPRRHPRARLAS